MKQVTTATWGIMTALALLVLCAGDTLAGTTGKISGRVTDAQTREAIPGASVVIDGTHLGAAANIDGYYFINNVPPGTYSLVVSLIGYQKTVVRGVVVKIDLTTAIDVKLNSTTVDVAEVVITAERPLVQKDLTSSSVTVSAEDIKLMPVENLGQVINLQAGVVGGHFRGGRGNEVAYLIDGVSVTDPFNGALGLQVENSSIREMEVISGTFNAEYGQAMSGVVNIVTQDGDAKFHGGFSGYLGDYFTKHGDLFPNLDRPSKLRTRSAQLTLSGPTVVLPDLTFFVTGRYYADDGYLYGKRVYNVTDDVALVLRDPNTQQIAGLIHRNTGDGAYVAMNPSHRYSLNGKLTYNLPAVKLSYSYYNERNWNKYYDHSFAWTPDGIENHYRDASTHAAQVTHVLSPNTYYSLKFTSNMFDYHGGVYDFAYDPRYVDPNRGSPPSNYTFRSGGNQGGRYERTSRTYIGQWNLTSQLSKEHKLGAGVEAQWHKIYNHGYNVVNMTENQYDSTGTPIFTLGYRQLGVLGNQAYTKLPFQMSAYAQDKIEYDIMIINAGVRFDYFNPRSTMLADLRNPTNNPNFPGGGELRKAGTKLQVSPRLGVSFPITDRGIIHFSYGHFFQIPSFENLYINAENLVTPGASLSSVAGNPDLDAQRTVSYEIGLQQVLFDVLALDFTVYYRDIRNLLGMEIINTYEGIKYARFINRDYANVRGFILSVDRRFADYFSFKADYTFQIAEGNASDPYTVYNNNQTDPPIETKKSVVPLNWDQRSTLNVSFNVGRPGDWTTGLIFSYGSGFPYTEDVRISQGVRFENGGIRPSGFNVDLRAEKSFPVYGMNINLFVLVYNLLDAKNEVNVNAASGRANVDLFTGIAGDLYGLNTIQQYLNDPTSFSAPRQIRFGVNLDF